MSNELEMRRLGVFTLALACGWFTISLYAAHASLPFNPIQLPHEKWVHASLWAPQAWGFYTRNPREDALLLFVRSAGGRWARLPFGPNRVDLSNAFGLDRVSRARLAEALSLASRIPKAAFQPCTEAPEACLERLPVAGTLPANFATLKLSGQVGIVMQPPVPWAWSVAKSAIVMPSRIARIEMVDR